MHVYKPELDNVFLNLHIYFFFKIVERGVAYIVKGVTISFLFSFFFTLNLKKRQYEKPIHFWTKRDDRWCTN